MGTRNLWGVSSLRVRLTLTVVAIFSLAAAGAAIAQSPPHSSPTPPPGVATKATEAANAAVAKRLPIDDPSDFEDARRGRIAQIDGGIIRNAKGETIWDANSFSFITGPAPASVNPSLWRQSKLNAEHGLFEVTPGIYQFRGYDIAVMTLIKGQTGWIVVDPLSAVESAAAGLALANKTLGMLPVSGIIFTHSHGDHFGGVAGLATAERLKSGSLPIVAPHGFILEAVSENVLAGPHMGRRAQFQFGVQLPRAPSAMVGTGLGQTLATGGTQSLAKPTLEVGAGSAPVTIDGVVFEFIDAANSEAPAEFMFYLPQFKALSSAEVATGTFHNVLTQRGAKVRDTLGWSKAIDSALRQYGDKAQVVFGSHNWPSWGPAAVRQFLAHHRDAYRYIHDQTLRRANAGGTMVEIAEDIGEPGFAKTDFSVRGYYGTYNHNAKAVYQHYFGWWDGVPAHYNPHPPVEESRRYVAAMGGTKKTLKAGTKAFEAGDYRWSSTLFNHLVFADANNAAAKLWLAASYEQQGFQAESGAWRNYFLKAAQELRSVTTPGSVLVQNAAYLAAIPTNSLFDAITARFNPAKYKGGQAVIRFDFTDRKEKATLHVDDSVVFPRMGADDTAANVSVTMTRADFDTVIAGSGTFPSLLASGAAKSEGDLAIMAGFFAALDKAAGNFNVVTP
jgi:alkyl sulfatase BDS1-like metallo-beta-lactamase superfamily hydrolase